MATRTGKASFQTQGRLLEELGERLVARADVALTELIKNAYDADATKCEVSATQKKLTISDNGHGMSEREFLKCWMQIATPDKQRRRTSTRFNRNVTGSKGIGRFAVRFLGEKLELQTVAQIRSGKKEKLKAVFDWKTIDQHANLQEVDIPYSVQGVADDESTGTTLITTSLRAASSDPFTKTLRTDLLSIVHPYASLDRGRFSAVATSDTDPGFTVVLPGDDEAETTVADEVLKNAHAHLTIDSRKTKTKFTISDKNGKTLLERTIDVRSHLSKGFFADIRYFPRRKGMFAGTGVDGRTAWKWVLDNQNNGIGIVDHGFRIRPYGFGENDWLQLSYDLSKRSRSWRSPYTNGVVTMPKAASADASANPMLYLPGFHQLIGAVFVESSIPDGDTAPDALTPSMDREGFIVNKGFNQLRDLVRTGLEMLAFVDHREQRRQERKRRKEKTRQLRSDFKSAIGFIESVPGLDRSDRQRVIDRFQELSQELDDAEDYHKVGLKKLELMGLLGVMAGFVTHEMQRVLHDIGNLVHKVKRLESKDKSIRALRESIEESLKTVADQLDYATTFVSAVHASDRKLERFSARGAVQLITKRFRSFTDARGISVKIDIASDVQAPRISKALYHGVSMNLFTNAIKAAIGGESASKRPEIVIKAWNEPKRHIFEVADNGIGIPPSLEKRIWDPLFTTTSARQYNPLGSGMGLGLTLVEQLVKDLRGTINLTTPPPGYSTCFRVTYPIAEAK